MTVRFDHRWPALIGASTLGWISVFLIDHSPVTIGICGARGDALADSWRTALLGLQITPPAPSISGWAAMVLAMNPPLLAAPLASFVCQGDRPSRGAITGFVAFYAAVWLLAGGIFMPIALLLQAAMSDTQWLPLAVMIGVTLGWRVTPAHRAAVDACRPAAAQATLSGFIGSAEAGIRLGVSCLLACWPLMLASLVAHPAHVGVMLIAMIVAVYDRAGSKRPHRPLRLRPALGARP